MSACSSGPRFALRLEQAAFCAAARRVKTDNARATAVMAAAAQRKLSESQFNAVKAAASADQRAGWAEAGFPTTRTAVCRLNAVLRRDCGLTVDILGRSVKATETMTGP